MALIAHVPHGYPIIPLSIPRSFLRDDSLPEERALAYRLDKECEAIYGQYFETGSHPLITAQSAREGIGETDQTTLFSNRSEDEDWMVRITQEATQAIPTKAICTYWDKLGPVVEYLKNHPHVGICFVSNYPHGKLSAEESARIIEENITTLLEMGVTNKIYVDTVADYTAWMEGKPNVVEAKFKAEGDMCKKLGVEWRPILKVSVHADASRNKTYGEDFFRSVYDMAFLAMKYGGNPKASTGQACCPPFNEFSPKDTGHISASLPLMVAVHRYNQIHGTSFYCKSSGGHENEADRAVLKYAADQLGIGIVMGASYRYLKRLLNFIVEQEGFSEEIKVDFFMPHGYDPANLPAYLLGLPNPNETAKPMAMAPILDGPGPV